MKKTVRYTVVFQLTAVLFLLLSGAFGGAVSTIFYYAAFVIPTVAFFAVRKHILPKEPSIKPVPTATDGVMTLPFLVPTIFGGVGLSALFSYLASFVSEPADNMLTGSFFILFLLHALVPAVLEEAVFRYIPLALISPESKKSAVIISAIFFALVHTSIEQIPYALLAGLVFAAVDVATDSILPSLVFHVLNNTVSILLQWDVSAGAVTAPVLIALAALTLASLAVIVIFRGKYREFFSFAFSREDKIFLTPDAAVFIVLMLVITVSAML